MSVFNEIKGLFTQEISRSPQFLVATKIKNLIIEDILAPNINCNFSYQLENSDYVDLENKNKEEEIIKLALKMLLGFEVDIGYGVVSIAMKKFLE